MSRWIAFDDAVAVVSRNKRLPEREATIEVRAAIALGEIEARDLRHLKLDSIPSLSGDDNREMDREGFLKWLAPNRTVEPAKPGDIYLSPFLAMMIQAVKEFEITEFSPGKKETLEAHFEAQKLPNGVAISKAQASYMATFCRSPEAMRGGNKRVG